MIKPRSPGPIGGRDKPRGRRSVFALLRGEGGRLPEGVGVPMVALLFALAFSMGGVDSVLRERAPTVGTLRFLHYAAALLLWLGLLLTGAFLLR